MACELSEKISGKIVPWKYRCATNVLNNFMEDIGKQLYKDINNPFTLKKLEKTGMVRKRFEVVCKEKHNMVYTIPLYSKARWSSVNFMTTRLKMISISISYLPHIVLHESERLRIDSTYKLPVEFVQAVYDAAYWKHLNDGQYVYEHICLCIGNLESDHGTISSAYACALSVQMHILDHHNIRDDEKSHLDNCMLRQRKRVYSLMHSLAFKCDQFYKSLHEYVQ